MPLPKLLVDLRFFISKMPGFSEKGAERFLDFWWRQEENGRKNFSDAWKKFSELNLCEKCFFFAEEKNCIFCQDNTREKEKICIVSSPFIIPLIEKTNYSGLYFVLDGEISGKNGGKQMLTIKKRRDYLKNRILKEKIEEVILATDFTSAGEATAFFIKEAMGDCSVKVSRLARGFQSGDLLSYSDPITIKSAIENRTSL